jgi:hypothetical protein
MGKTLLDIFDDAFLRELSQARNHPEAYERATEKFEIKHGFVPFENGYDSFRRKKMLKRKKKRY